MSGWGVSEVLQPASANPSQVAATSAPRERERIMPGLLDRSAFDITAYYGEIGRAFRRLCIGQAPSPDS